ncbi:MAG: substrate-binding domain-containing protein [Victivallales bacterium]|nr:substrate-binding domain-containing protein [Victivallales bacterium]
MISKSKSESKSELKKDIAYKRILAMILNGNIGDRFPSEPVLSSQLGISRVTLRAALERLATEGLISRSHYYGTRILNSEMKRQVLVVHASDTGSFRTSHIQAVLHSFEMRLKEKGYRMESTSFHFLQSAEKISEKYCGVLFFGAAMTGDEPFIKTLSQCTVPVILNREDHENTLAHLFSSVGTDIRSAWLSGYDYLLGLGYRRIATFCSNDIRNQQRLGLSSQEMAEELKKKGAYEAAELVFRTCPEDCQDDLIRIIRSRQLDALYCYSGYMAAQAYRIAKERSLKIPGDLAILSFGDGSNLMSPSLSSVDLNYTLCGIAEAELLLKMQNKNVSSPVHLSIPHYINAKESTQNYLLQIPTLSEGGH